MKEGAIRVVVVGATGNFGTSIVSRLSRDDAVESIVAVARRQPSLTLPKTTWIEADIVEDGLGGVLDGADAVVHLAWEIQPTRDPQATHRVNAVGSARLFDAVDSAGVGTLLYASSVGAYSPLPNVTVDESAPTHGVATSMYSLDKAYVERMLDAFELANPDTRVVRFRPAFALKRSAASEQRRFFLGSLFPRVLADPRFVPFMPSLAHVRFQVVHTDDVAEAFHLALHRDVRGAFNLAATPSLDMGVVAGLLDARQVRIPVGVARTLTAATWRLRLHPVDPGLLDLLYAIPLLDTSRAERELDWQPQRDAVSTLRESIAGLRAGAGADTPTLQPDADGRTVADELATGQGADYSTDPRTG